MEQTRNGISDERLAAILDVDNAKYSTGVHVQFSEVQDLARELRRYKKALHDHLCEYDAADWLGCTGHPDSDNCVLCDADRGLLPKSGCFHENLVNQARELTALRASHKRLVEALEEIERHHLELNRAAGRQANRSRTLRMCAAALIDAKKLESK